MSNLHHSVDDGFEGWLREKPFVRRGFHTALNFLGNIHFDGELFVEDVERHHVHVGQAKDMTLAGLMERVNEKWGPE